MVHKKTMTAGILALALCFCASPAQVLAGSPEFAYTAEKWASLRDDNLEYDEIADLVHEYNNTVIQNQIEYEEYRGETQDDIAEDYYDAADELYASLYYPSSGDEDYASALTSYLSGQLQADELKEQGDDNLEDGDIKKLGYDQMEAELVKQAQELMITYWSQTKSMESLKQTKEQAESSYQSILTKLSAGMSTQAEVSAAAEAVTSAQASILTAETNLDTTKETLCLMLGWKYGAQVAIGQVPEPDLDSISVIDIEADVDKGVEANYALKILQKKIENAQSGSTKESLEAQYKSQKETVASSIKSDYQSLILAKSEYGQALQAYELESDNMDTAERKMQAGIITRNDYISQKASCITAQASVETSQLALLTAMLDYQWSVDGLASVS